MKKSLVLLLSLGSLIALGQSPVVTKQEPVALYLEINSALSLGHTRQALSTFNRVVEFYNDENRVDELPESYLGMALALAFNGDYKASIRYHKKALRYHKKYRTDSPTEIYANLSLTYQLAGRERHAHRLQKRI